MSDREIEGEVLRARMALLALTCARGSPTRASETRYIINASDRAQPLAEAESTIAELAKPLICDGKAGEAAFIATFEPMVPGQVPSHAIGVREQSAFFRAQLDRVKPAGLELLPDSQILFGRDLDRMTVSLQDLEHWLAEYSLQRRLLSVGAPPTGVVELGVITVAPPPSMTGFGISARG
jgi:hypothetical protein